MTPAAARALPLDDRDEDLAAVARTRVQAPALVPYPDEPDDAVDTRDDLDEEAHTTDLVRVYLTEIGRVRLLTAEQEVELSKRIEAGLYAEEKLRCDETGDTPLAPALRSELAAIADDGHRAKDHLLEANLRLVVSLAKRYQGKGLPLLDLVQEGNLGLVRAVEKFDYTKGYKFSTYATWWIRQALQRATADQGRTIRIPVHMVEQINKALRVKRELTVELGRDPSTEEIAAVVGSTPEKVEEVLGYGRDTLSLESPVGDEGESTLGDFIQDTDAVDASTVVDQRLLHEQVTDLLAGLPPRAAVIVALRFGLTDGRVRTLAEVGQELGLTRERVRQIEQETLLRLRHQHHIQALRAYLS